MDALEGIWRLVDTRAWMGETERLRPSAPLGWHPMGFLAFSEGRLLAAVCNGDTDVGSEGDRDYSSYGGTYSFDGTKLECMVDVASDSRRIGVCHVQTVVMLDECQILLWPTPRHYGSRLERRELVWERAWHPGGVSVSPG